MCCSLLLVPLLLTTVDSARILALFPHPGKSHFDVFEPLMLKLAERGHDVNVLSFYPQQKTVGNYTDYSLVGSVPLFVNALSFDMVASVSGFDDFHSITNFGLVCCEPVLTSSAVKSLLNSNKTFDLVIMEVFNIDCFLGLAHRFEAPIIGMSSTGLMVSHNGRFGNPLSPANVPNLQFPFSDKMSFSERIVNSVSVLYFKLVRKYYYDSAGDRIMRKCLGEDLPDLEEMARDVQLLFTNTHYSLNRPRPLVPAIIPVGGLHIKPVQKLSQPIQKFIDESKHGVVLFSMGSVLLANTFPQEKRDAFMNAFAELPQRFIMKWENETFPNQPKNLITLKWLPQRDMLAHPNVKAFICHGGLLGLSEAVYSGVPVIGMPIFGDQPSNIAAIVSIGAGIRLNYSTLTKDDVLTALKKVIYEQSYKETAKKLAAVYTDRPLSAIDTAVYWTEFVLRHNGTPFLQSAAVHQPWYEELLLDVVSTLIVGFTIVLYILFYISKTITIFIANILYKKDIKRKHE